MARWARDEGYERMDGWMKKSKKKKEKHCYLFTSLIYTCEFPTKFCTHTIHSYTLLTHRPHNKHNIIRKKRKKPKK